MGDESPRKFVPFEWVMVQLAGGICNLPMCRSACIGGPQFKTERPYLWQVFRTVILCLCSLALGRFGGARRDCEAANYALLILVMLTHRTFAEGENSRFRR